MPEIIIIIRSKIIVCCYTAAAHGAKKGAPPGVVFRTSDRRASAVAMGATGILFIVASIAFVIALDVCTWLEARHAKNDRRQRRLAKRKATAEERRASHAINDRMKTEREHEIRIPTEKASL